MQGAIVYCRDGTGTRLSAFTAVCLRHMDLNMAVQAGDEFVMGPALLVVYAAIADASGREHLYPVDMPANAAARVLSSLPLVLD